MVMTLSSPILGQAADATQQVTLNTGGIIVMSFSILLVLGLMIFCIVKIFRETTPGTHHHAPLDIDTGDEG